MLHLIYRISQNETQRYALCISNDSSNTIEQIRFLLGNLPVFVQNPKCNHPEIFPLYIKNLVYNTKNQWFLILPSRFKLVISIG